MTQLVTNALGRMVPAEINGQPAVPFAGVRKHRPSGHKAAPPIATCADYPAEQSFRVADERPVAVDRVGLEILERKRAAEGLPPLAAEDRPVRYLASAAARRLGCAELADIEVVSIGKSWLDVN